MPVLCDQFTQCLDSLTITLVSETSTNDTTIIQGKRIMDHTQSHPSHSISLGSDPPPPWQTTTQQFFLFPQALENLISPQKETKSHDNSNTWNMFNNTLTLLSKQATNTCKFFSGVMLKNYLDHNSNDHRRV